MRDWLVKWIGTIGTGALLTLTVLTYIIWRFDPEFKLPKRKPKQLKTEVSGPVIPDVFNEEYNQTYYHPEESFSASSKDAIEKGDVLTSNNKLKNEGSVVVIMP